MECKNSKECRVKSKNWIMKQEKYRPIGEQEFERFYEKYKKGEATLEFDQHYSKRCFERAVTDHHLKEALEFGWVIERGKTAGQISIVLLCYVGENFRPLHFVFNVISENKWIAITTYTPRSHSWKWSDDFMTRICFCNHEMECE